MIFLDQILPKSVFPVKNQKTDHHHWNLHIRISLGIKLHCKLIILIFLTKFAQKRLFLVKKRKSKHRHWTLDIRIGIGTKFQLKLTILTVWIKFTQKEYFQSETEKLNINIELYIYDTLCDLVSGTICMILRRHTNVC